MKKGLLTGMLCVLSIALVGVAWAARPAPGSSLAHEPTPAQRQLVVSKLSSMPLAFTENQGQFGEKTKFRCNAMGATFYFATGEVAYLFSRQTDERMEETMGPWTSVSDMPDSPDRFSRPRYKREGLLVRAGFVGANPNAEVVGEGMLPHKCNYFYGNDPSKWHTDVPNYSSVRYQNIYPGIDLRYYGDGRSLKYDFIVKPGTDLSRIQIEYDGVNSLSVNTQGELVVSTKFGDVIERVPYAYQKIRGKREQISCRYAILDRERIGFALDSDWDRSQPLYIDPQLAYSTYLGGNDYDYGYGIAVDGSGCAYVTGEAYSTDFPTANPYDGSWNGASDVFITKFSPFGSSLIYSTYLGGNDYDHGYGITVDGSGCAYVTGETRSDDFPTANPYSGSYNGGYRDVFVAKLSASGDSLIYSTYLGGSGDDRSQTQSIAVDGSGCAYVTGSTRSDDFPTTANPYDGNLDGSEDAFVTKLSVAGDSLIYSTYLGGNYVDYGYGIAVDGSDCAYVTGYTLSDDFPTTPGAYKEHYYYYDGTDAFVTKFSTSGSSLLYSTYYGGSNDESGRDIAVDGTGCAYVMGNSEGDILLIKLSPSGSHLFYSTYLGGNDSDAGWSMAMDSESNLWVAGYTSSSDFPTVNPYDGSWNGGGDAFVLKLSPSDDSLLYSTYLGGDSYDCGRGIAVDGSGCAYVTGETWSEDFPTANPYQEILIGYRDAFVARFGVGTEEWIAVTSPNGGENWTIGSEHDITWTSVNFTGNVKIEYSTNGGTDWTPIVSSTEDDGTHPWTIPDDPSTDCLVKVSDAADGDPSDVSDAPFTISTPPGSIVGSVTDSYTQEPIEGALVDAMQGENTIGSDSTESDGSYSIPNLPPGNYDVRASKEYYQSQTHYGVEVTEGQPTTEDFQLEQLLRVLTPNGGQGLRAGGQCTITWTELEGSGISKVWLLYTLEGDNPDLPYEWITTEPIPDPVDHTYSWTVADTILLTARVIILGLDASEEVIAWDCSDENFAIYKNKPVLLNKDFHVFGWDPWPGADHYKITFTIDPLSYAEEKQFSFLGTRTTNFTKLSPEQWSLLKPAKWSWNVVAYNQSGEPIHDYQLDKPFIMVNVESKGYEGDQPVVLMHGWAEDASSWGSGDESLIDELGARGYNPWTVEYPNTGDMRLSAGGLEAALRYITHTTGFPKAYLITYDIGGLVARAYTEGIAKDSWGNAISYNGDVDRLVTLACPNHGHAKIFFGHLSEFGLFEQWFIPWPGLAEATAAYEQMMEESDFLGNLNNIHQPNPAVPYLNVYGIKPTYPIKSVWKWFVSIIRKAGPLGKGPSDGVVTLPSAYINDENVVNSHLDRNHTDIRRVKSNHKMINLIDTFFDNPSSVESDSDEWYAQQMFQYIVEKSSGSVMGIKKGSSIATLPGAFVTITTPEIEESGMSSSYVLLTDSLGYCYAPCLPFGNYILEISAQGYLGRSISIESDTISQQTMLNISLEPDDAYQGPTLPAIIINGGAITTDDSLLNLTLSVNGATEMMLCEKPTFEGVSWEPFSSQKQFPVSGSQGLKLVCARFRDGNGYESSVVFDDIILNTEGGGQILVTSNIDSARIYLDGRPTEEVTPCTFSNIPVGSHIISVSKPEVSSAPVYNAVNVDSGQVVEAQFTLSPSSPPNSFSLLIPTDGDTAIGGRPTFSWEVASDPDPGNTVTYAFLCSQDSAFTTYDKEIWGIDGPSYTLMTPLPDSGTYYWKIKAVDNLGACTWSNEIWSFYVPFDRPPNPFSLLLPSNGDTVSYQDTLDWEDSSDPDAGDTLLYTLYMSLEPNFPVFSTVRVDSLSQSEYILSPEGVFSAIANTRRRLLSQGKSEKNLCGILASPNLLSDTSYYWKVKAWDSWGMNTWCNQLHWSFIFIENVPPAAITDLAVSGATGDSVTLIWTAPGDDDTVGTATSYDIRYSTVGVGTDTSAWWDTAYTVANEPPPSPAGSQDTCTVSGLLPDTTYYFVIRTADEVPNWSGFSNVAAGTTIAVGVNEIADRLGIPKTFELSQNYPNPFNPITEIKYGLPRDCRVRLEVYNILGQKVASLVDGKQKAGYKTVRWDAGALSSGIYFYRLQAGDFVETKKMILLK